MPVMRFQPGLPWNGIDLRRVAEEVRLPLVGVAADEAVEVLEAHAGRPLVEGPDLARGEGRRVVVLAEPRRRVAVVEQHAADGGLVLADDAVVAGEAGRLLGDHAEAGRVVVAPGDQRGARRRAQRGREHAVVAQAFAGEAVHRRRRDHAAEGAGHAEAGVVGDDQEHVGRALGRHHARRPPRLRLQRVVLDHAAELRVGRRELPVADGRRRAGRARRAGDLLCACLRGAEERHDDRGDEGRLLQFHGLLQGMGPGSRVALACRAAESAGFDCRLVREPLPRRGRDGNRIPRVRTGWCRQFGLDSAPEPGRAGHGPVVALRGAAMRRDQLHQQPLHARRQVVPHALDHLEATAPDVQRRVAPGGERNQRVVAAVDDERRRRDALQQRAAIPGREYRQQLARSARGVEAAAHDPPDVLPQQFAVHGESGAADHAEHADVVLDEGLGVAGAGRAREDQRAARVACRRTHAGWGSPSTP